MFPTLLLKSVKRYQKYIHRAIAGFLEAPFHVSILQEFCCLLQSVCTYLLLDPSPSSLESASLREIVDLSALLQISSLICFHLRNIFLNLFWIVVLCLFIWQSLLVWRSLNASRKIMTSKVEPLRSSSSLILVMNEFLSR